MLTERRICRVAFPYTVCPLYPSFCLQRINQLLTEKLRKRNRMCPEHVQTCQLPKRYDVTTIHIALALA